MKLKPLHDQVLVLRVESEAKTSGGIIIPDSAKEKPLEGEIIAVGPGIVNKDGNRVPLDVEKGNRVLFQRYAGTEVKINGVEHLMMREDDILCIIE